MVDVFHPLVSLEWTECTANNVYVSNAHLAWLNNTLYMGGGTANNNRNAAKLYIYSPVTDTWDSMSTPVFYFALATYRSQLVLIGGVEHTAISDVSKKVLTLNELGQLVETLPSMKNECWGASAVSYREHLLVADCIFNRIEVFDGHEWSSAQPLPSNSHFMFKSTVFHGYWYLMGGTTQRKEVYCASLDSLIASTQPSQASKSLSIWNQLLDLPEAYCYPAVFGNNLIVITALRTPNDIYAYSQHTQSWEHVGNVPGKKCSPCCIALPTSNELIVIAEGRTFKAALKMKHFDLEALFTMKALKSLEAAGIPLMGSLSNYAQNMQNALGLFPLHNLELNLLLSYWVRNNTSISPSWKNLLLVIRLLDLEDLAQLTETFLKGTTYDDFNKLTLVEEPKSECQEEAPVKEFETVSGIGHLQSSALGVTSAWSLRGVEAYREMTALVYSSQAQQIRWECFGLKVHIHEGSLPAGMEYCNIKIMVSLEGQYEFPDSSHLISAIFWIRCEPSCKFIMPIGLEIQHCGKVDNKLKLRFVRALCSQKQLPYSFKHFGGTFTPYSSYGIIELNCFSGVGIVQEESDERNYLATLLYKEVKNQPARCIVEIYIAITWNLAAHRNAVINRFSAQIEIDQPISFESDQIEFQISNISHEKWEIKCLNSPVVMKRDVDCFIPGQTSWIPCTKFKAKFSDDPSHIRDLECDVDIIGARQPHNKFVIDISPQSHFSGPQQALAPLPPPETRLTDTHHAHLLQQLQIHAARWKDVGTYLGFRQGELDNIQLNAHLSVDPSTRCLSEILNKWLQWAPGDARGSTNFATLESLKDALRQAGLGATANDLRLQ